MKKLSKFETYKMARGIAKIEPHNMIYPVYDFPSKQKWYQSFFDKIISVVMVFTILNIATVVLVLGGYYFLNLANFIAGLLP